MTPELMYFPADPGRVALRISVQHGPAQEPIDFDVTVPDVGSGDEILAAALRQLADELSVPPGLPAAARRRSEDDHADQVDAELAEMTHPGVAERLTEVRAVLADEFPDASVLPDPDDPTGAVRAAPAAQPPADESGLIRWRRHLSRMETDLTGAGFAVHVPEARTHLTVTRRRG